MSRLDGRSNDQLRGVKFTRDWLNNAEGSVLVEFGNTSGDEITKIAQDYLADMKKADIDTLVLGCTHYPLLTGVISYVMGNDVTLVSSAEETAKDLYRNLVEADLLNTPGAPVTHRFVATADADKFATLARRFLGPEVLKVTTKI